MECHHGKKRNQKKIIKRRVHWERDQQKHIHWILKAWVETYLDLGLSLCPWEEMCACPHSCQMPLSHSHFTCLSMSVALSATCSAFFSWSLSLSLSLSLSILLSSEEKGSDGVWSRECQHPSFIPFSNSSFIFCWLSSSGAGGNLFSLLSCTLWVSHRSEGAAPPPPCCAHQQSLWDTNQSMSPTFLTAQGCGLWDGSSSCVPPTLRSNGVFYLHG